VDIALFAPVDIALFAPVDIALFAPVDIALFAPFAYGHCISRDAFILKAGPLQRLQDHSDRYKTLQSVMLFLKRCNLKEQDTGD
jgi:hypothetical protein